MSHPFKHFEQIALRIEAYDTLPEFAASENLRRQIV
jgi:hypothetical protein